MNTNENKRMWVVFWSFAGPKHIESCFEEKEDAEARIAELDYQWPEQKHEMQWLRVFVSEND